MSVFVERRAGAEPLPPMPADPAAALERYEPERGHGPWDRRFSGHLFRRALGGAGAEAARDAARNGAAATLDSLFRPVDPERQVRWARLGARLTSGDRADLAAWWLLKLAQDDRAPGTRLTLFWHDHFATAQSKVQDLGHLYRQHQLFVEAGEGPFEELLAGVARDPAMLVFLDGDSNRRGVPNENFAREIFELFALGVGHYRESDVQEAARALTGRTVRRGAYRFVPEHHDPDPKVVFEETIQDGDDLVRVTVARSACPRFLIGKLWRWYVSPEPHEEAVELLAERWRQRGLETGWLLRELLSSRAFFSREAYRSLVKSPVDLFLGWVRALGARPDFMQAARSCAAMGQELFEPPGVQGWKDGESWIHSASWIERTNFAARLSRGGDWARGAALDRLFPKQRRSEPAHLLEDLVTVFLDGSLEPSRLAAIREGLDSADDAFVAAAHAILCLPEYHLS